MKWNGSAWVCAADDNSTYTAGPGLDLNGSEFSIEEPYRLPQNCAGGEAATRNTAVGGGAATWTCEQFAQADQVCTSGQFARGVTAIGTLSCAAPATSGLQAFSAQQPTRVPGDGIPDDDQFHTFASVNVPAGSYLVLSSGTIRSLRNVSGQGFVSCHAHSDSVFLNQRTLNEVEQIPFALTSLATLESPGTISLECRGADGADGISLSNAEISALKVG